MMKRILVISFAACLFLMGRAQTEISLYGSDKSQVEGITYMLPKNRIMVTVTATKYTYTPGEYCRFAEEYLRMPDVKSESSVAWKLDRIEAHCVPVPDKDKTYFIKVAEKTSAPRVQLSPDGLLLAVNDQIEYQPLEQPTPIQKAEKKRLSPEDYYTQDIIRAASATATARLIAEEIYQVREKRSELTGGELENMPKDGASMELMLRELADQEEALTSVFSGTTESEQQQVTFVVEPDAEVAEKVLFRFSQKLGIVDEENMAGSPVYYSLKSKHTVPDKTPRTEEDRKRVEKKQKEGEKRAAKGDSLLMEGVVYNGPVRGECSVYTPQQKILSAEYKVAQLGNTDVLLNELFNKKSTFHVTFNQNDGSILKVWQEEEKK